MLKLSSNLSRWKSGRFTKVVGLLRRSNLEVDCKLRLSLKTRLFCPTTDTFSSIIWATFHNSCKSVLILNIKFHTYVYLYTHTHTHTHTYIYILTASFGLLPLLQVINSRTTCTDHLYIAGIPPRITYSNAQFNVYLKRSTSLSWRRDYRQNVLDREVSLYFDLCSSPWSSLGGLR